MIEMAEKSRNFRSSYYDKVGFRGVEEKKSLEILINEKPMDTVKLSKFCLFFTLPTIYREYVWKVLLDVIPVSTENHKAVTEQRSDHYKELEHSLKIMNKINPNTPKSIVHTLMYILTKDLIEFNFDKQLSSTKIQSMSAVASLFIKLSSSDVDAYWMFRNFLIRQRKFSSNFLLFSEQFEIILKKEDEVLYEHLKSIKAFNVLPFDTWFERYFAEILHETSLARMCDRVIGGNCKILPYVGVAMLVVHRHILLPVQDPQKTIELLQQIPEDISDVVINKALDLFYS